MFIKLTVCNVSKFIEETDTKKLRKIKASGDYVLEIDEDDEVIRYTGEEVSKLLNTRTSAVRPEALFDIKNSSRTKKKATKKAIAEPKLEDN